MKIFYICETISDSETFINSLSQGLKNSFDLTLIIDKKNHNIKKTPYIEIPYFSKLDRSIFYFNFLLKLLFKKDYRINMKQIISSYIIKPILNNKPDAVFIEFGFNAVLLYKILIKLKIPYIIHFHGRDASQDLSNSVYRTEIINACKNSSYNIVASNFIRRRLALAGVSEHNIKLIKLGINIDFLETFFKDGKKTLFPSLIYVGRLVEKKNPIALLKSFSIVLKKYPKAILNIIGDGPLKSDVLQFIKINKLENSVRVKGTLKPADVFTEMNSSWVYVQHCVTSSRGDQEGFSVSMLEAAFFKLPVVSTFHNGIPENVLHKRTGFLVNEFDYEKMADKILILISDPQLISKMGSMGRDRVLKSFRSSERINNFISLLNKV
jgi:colanic acid/amylovoran biosynthesis glycosyltransferase